MDVLTRSLMPSSFEQRFNCLICWSPKLRMVYGSCQHRLCVDCLYDSNGVRRNGLEKCPTCQTKNAFPLLKPSIPEDNIDLQRQIGVVLCTSPGCETEMWYWELESHLSECCFNNVHIRQKSKKRRRNSEYSHEYNLRHSSKRRSPGGYSTSKTKIRSAKRKLNSV